uniref:Ig-like domain-containing protein n=1 Tax=Amphilophus citrinellus TaxID=61819 RepID=A0A3Q0T026_AMPCI
IPTYSDFFFFFKHWGEPSPEVSWFRNGLPVGVKNATPLRIQQVSLADQGTYQCVASNSAGQETLEIKLEILGECHKLNSSHSPHLLSCVSGPAGMVLGFPAVLPCDVEGSPTPSITWLKDNQPIVSTPQLTYTRGGQALRLGSAQGDSSGHYTCKATNPAGTAIKHYSLSVLGKSHLHY